MIQTSIRSCDTQDLSFSPASLVDLLVYRATHQRDRLAYTFLIDGDDQEATLTYGDLDRRARAIAARLQQTGKPGDRVLLLYPPGLDYIEGFFGCQYAGAVAVPLYPPRLNRKMERVFTVAADSQATVALTIAGGIAKISHLLKEVPSLKLDWLCTDQIEDGLADDWQEPQLDGSSLSFLQYTSGSTSAPKGVMVSQGNLLDNERLVEAIFGQTEQSVIVSWLPLYHDMGLIGSVLQPLYVGSRCILMSPAAFLQRPLRWLRAISRYRASTSGGPNFAYDLCARRISPADRKTLDLSSWDVAFNGAEPIREATLRNFTDVFAECGFHPEAFHPCYGLAEATLIVSGKQGKGEPVIKEVRADSLAKNRIAEPHSLSEECRRVVSSGKSSPGQKIVIAHPELLTRCLPDEVGEIWVSSRSVAQGYWNRAEQTDHTFRAFLSDTNEGPFLRTGDLGFMINGELFITGRLKDLIIIRGMNYYPQEIEITVQQVDPALRQGCGAAFSIEVSGEEQVAVVQEIQNHYSDVDGLIEPIRQAVAKNHDINLFALALVQPGSIPKTSSGKIQRSACRELFLSRKLRLIKEWRAPVYVPGVDQSVKTPAAALQTVEELEAWLASTLAKRLALDPRSIDHSQPISIYGVDSVTAISFAHGIEEALGVTLPVFNLLESPTIAQLAAEVAVQKTMAAPSASLATTESAGADYPLSIGQQALWFLHQLAPSSAAYNIAAAVRFKAGVDVDALRGALRVLADRHSALRTIFVSQPGGATQRAQRQAGDFFNLMDAASWSETALDDYLAEEANRPFDLEQGPLLRVTLCRRASRDDVLLLVAHHIILDFWSLVVIAHELGVAYAAERAGAEAELPPIAFRYADYVCRQREMLAGPRGEQLRAYWQERLAGVLPRLNLPGDRALPSAPTDQGSSHTFRLSDELVRKIKSVCRLQNTTLYVTLLAAFQTLLYRYTGQEDILVGSPMACRDSADLKTVVGYLTNSVVLRSRFSPDQSFRECLLQTRQEVLGALAHQDYPFALLVESLQPAREPGRSPLFRVLFSLQKSHLFEEEDLASFMLGEDRAQARLGELRIESLGLRRRAVQFDLSLITAEARGSLAASFVYSTDLFDRSTILRMEQHFRTLLEGIALDPEQAISLLPLLSQPERDQMLISWNDTRLAYPEVCFVHRLFEAQAELTPEAVAVTDGEEHLTYSMLNVRANRLASRLRALDVRPEALVGVCMPRSIEMVVAILAVLKAGGAYVPLDATYPEQRLAFIVNDAGVRVILTQERLRENLPGGMAHLICLDCVLEELAEQSPDNHPDALKPDNLAYVLYTSGSTGQPKGVMIGHRGLVSYLTWVNEALLTDTATHLPMTTKLIFDASLKQLLPPLLRGGEAWIQSEETVSEPALLLRQLATRDEVALNCVPSLWAALLDTIESDKAKMLPASLKRLYLSGEPSDRSLVRRTFISLPWLEVWNIYGPTEVTANACAGRLFPDDRVTIGRPIANTRTYLLDEQSNPVPVGIQGQLHIAGIGLARGYLNAADLTAAGFVPDPFGEAPGQRMFKTGDLACYLPGGEIEFLGRMDNQVKLRGYRIELEEIESALSEQRGVSACVVVVRQDGAGSKYLAAYIAADRRATVRADDLRKSLARRLPEYMLPSIFVLLESLPLMANGKIDRNSLPEPEPLRSEDRETFVAPRTQVESMLTAMWEQVFDVRPVGIHDNFFALGGHSLLASHLVSKVRKAFGVEVSLKDLFECPSVAGLAAAIDQAKNNGTSFRIPKLASVPRERHLARLSSQGQLKLPEALKDLKS